MGNPRGGARAPDNNKRLAVLEAGVSALAIALTANGVTVPEGADPVELAIGVIKAHAEAAAGAGTSTGELEQLRARVAELETEKGELETDLEDITGEKNRLAGLLNDDGKSQNAGEEPEQGGEKHPFLEAQPALVRPEGARDVGPEYPVFEKGELRELLGPDHDGEGLELVFSNGDYEILALQPVPITVPQLQRMENSFIVIPAIHAKLSATDQPEQIDGVGLLYGGEQIAYCRFPSKLPLPPGGERRFDRAIIF